MSEKVKITVKCNTCGFTDDDAGKGLRFIATSLMCCECGFQADVQAAIVEPEQSGMTFMQAVEAVKSGAKARRTGWLKGCYIEKIGVGIWNYRPDHNSRYGPEFKDFEATDWEIVK